MLGLVLLILQSAVISTEVVDKTVAEFHMSPLVGKVLVMIGLIILGVSSTLLAFRVKEQVNILSMGNCFSAGVLLSAGLVHMLPDAADDFKSVKGAWPDDFPMASVCAGIGFWLVMVVEMLPRLCSKHPMKSTGLDEELLTTNRSPRSGDHDPHSHLDFLSVTADGDVDSLSRSISAVLFLFVLSVHSVIAGISIGIDPDFPFSVVIAVFAHKGFAAFALGTSLVKADLIANKRCLLISLVLTFACATPLGICLGLAFDSLDKGGAALRASFAGVAAGTFIYISNVEILVKEMENLQCLGRNLFAFGVGFGAMASLALVL